MGRQTFSDGPAVDPPLASVASYSTVTIAPLWPAALYTPIFAGDPKVGKIYSVKAGGIITMSVATCSMIITPKYGTGGVALGAGPAQLLPVMTNIPWFLQAELVFRTIGAAGANSTAVLSGVMSMQGTIATAGAGTNVVFGSTASVSVDATILANLEFNTTLGGTTGSPSIQTLWAYIFSRN
jgi:hypothetical protein